MTELGNQTHVPWFLQAYDKYVEGQRFADQNPGTRTYSGLTLGNRRQGTKLAELNRQDIHDQQDSSQRSREKKEGMHLL